MIVVTAPTGHIGSRLLEELASQREPIRIVARDPEKLPKDVRERAEVLRGSHRDPQIVDRAFAGADVVFWLMPAEPSASSIYQTYVGDSIPAADAVVRHRVPRIVTVSALGRGTQQYAGHVSASLAMDDLFRSTGAHVRAIANPSFMDNVARQTATIGSDGVLTGTLPGDLKLPMVAARDVAAVAARLLLDHTWVGQDTVPLLGGEDLSHDEVVAVLTDVLGHPVRYERGEREIAEKALVGHGMSEAVARALMDMDRAKEHGLDTAVPRTPQNTTPTTFRQWAREAFAEA